MHPRLLPTTLIAAAALIMTTAGAAPPLTTQPAPIRSGWTAQQAPGFYRLRLGDFRITVVSDGTAARDLSAIMSDPAKVRQAYADSHEGLPAELSINCYVIETGTQTILVDTGAGELFGATGGHLVENLRAAGYAPEDIDAVLLTHIHADHSGGLSIGGKRVFPNALVYVDQRDPAYWLDPQHETQAPADKRLSFQQSRQTVGPYLAAGKLRTFDGAQQLFDGVRSVSLHGHTPGMSGYMVESRGQRLLLWGDRARSAGAVRHAGTVNRLRRQGPGGGGDPPAHSGRCSRPGLSDRRRTPVISGAGACGRQPGPISLDSQVVHRRAMSAIYRYRIARKSPPANRPA
jgi:glyoxylase-like metal-dependent hydrolase (beta-lactamase superfamily II)